MLVHSAVLVLKHTEVARATEFLREHGFGLNVFSTDGGVVQAGVEQLVSAAGEFGVNLGAVLGELEDELR